MEKRSFLLTQAKDVSQASSQVPWSFDENLQMNTMLNEHNEIIPVCSLSSVITGSKTEAAPGDDDPDPDAEFCY